jgi:hypothetical protein
MRGSSSPLSSALPNFATRWIEVSVTLIGAHEPELGLHEQILECIFGDRRQRGVEPEHAAMAHGVEFKIAEGDRLHLAIGGVILDPIFVASVAVARMQHGRVPVGHSGQLVEASARERAEPVEMRLQAAERRGIEIEREQLAQTRVDAEEIQAAAVRRQPVGAPGCRGRRSAALEGNDRHRRPRYAAASTWRGR